MSIARVTLKNRRAKPFFARHPWVFPNAIRPDKHLDDLEAGSPVDVHSEQGQFIARGLWNPLSHIRVRLYTWDSKQNLDADFWASRIDHAVSLRERLFGTDYTNRAARIIFSEGDGLSGLTVDRYHDSLLVQFTSHALHQYADTIVEAIQQRIQPAGIWLRTERGMRDEEGLEAADGLICGTEPPQPMFIEEHGIRFNVNVVSGQKTGFYIDQRDNRLAAAKYTNDHRVLDAFCYSGGFGITAAKQGGAKEVVGIDSSESALELATANAKLNEVDPICRFEKGDVRNVLKQMKSDEQQFDTVILDPPRMARKRSGLTAALRGYFHLNRSAVDLIPAGGILVTCSCSGLVDRESFEQMLASVAADAHRDIQILESLGQPADHPIAATCREGRYLKCLICRVA